MPSRTQAWIQIVIGIGLVILGVGSIVSGESKIYLGALIVGPFIAYRGFRALAAAVDFYEKNPHLDATVDSPKPEAVKTLALSPRSIHIDVTCEACRTPYVYFPERTQETLEQVAQYGVAAAPCPNCGWVQSFMYHVAGKFTARPIVVTALAYAAGAGFCVGTVGFMYTMMFYYGGSREAPPVSEPICWTVVVSGTLIGVGCGVAWTVMRGGNPNRAPLAQRLEEGKRLGMTLANFDSMVQTEDWNSSTPQASTGVMGSTRSDRASPETGIQGSGPK